MAKYIRPTGPYTNAELGVLDAIRDERFSNFLVPSYLNEGEPSFNPPNSNLFSNIGDRLVRSGTDLGFGGGLVLQSGASFTAALGASQPNQQLPLRTAEGDQVLMPDGTYRKQDTLMGGDYFDALDPNVRYLMESNGFSRNNFSDIQSVDAAEDRYNNILFDIELNQSLQRYAEERPGWSKVGAVGSFIAEAATDPITLATLGTGALVGVSKAGAKVTATQLLKQTAKETAEIGIRKAGINAFKSVATGEARILPNVLQDYRAANRFSAFLVGSAVASPVGMGYDYLAQVAEHYERVDRLGVTGPFEIDYARSGLSVLMMAGFGGLGGAAGYRSTPKPLTNRDVVRLSPTSTVGRRFYNKARRGTASEDALADIIEVDVVDTADRISKAVYSINDYEEISDLLENVRFAERVPYGNAPNESVVRIKGPEALEQMKSRGLRVGSGVELQTPGSTTMYVVDEITPLGLLKVSSGFGETKLIQPNEAVRYFPEGIPTYGERNTNLGFVIEDSSETLLDLTEAAMFFEQIPTAAEAKRYLRTGEYFEPEYHSLLKQRDELVQRYRDLQSLRTLTDAHRKTIKKLDSQIKSVEADMRRVVDGGEVRDALGNVIQTYPRGYNISQNNTDSVKIATVLRGTPLRDVRGRKPDRIKRTTDLLGLGEADSPERSLPQIQKATYSVFSALSKAFSIGTLAREGDKLNIKGVRDHPLAIQIAKMFGAFDPRIANDSYTGPDGTGIKTTPEHQRDVRILRQEFDSALHHANRKKNNTQKKQIAREVVQIRSQIKSSSGDAAVDEIVKGISKYFDEMGKLARRAGIIKEEIVDYLPVRLIPEKAADKLDELTALLAKRWYDGEYADGTKLHRNTLKTINLVDVEGRLLSDVYDSVPTELDDLTPEHQTRYKEALIPGLEEEARWAISRKVGTNRGKGEDPIAREENRPVQFREDARSSRKIEQKFWYSDEVIDLEVIDLDLAHLVYDYEAGMGMYISRQLAMNEIFGEPVRFEDALEVMRNSVAADDPLRDTFKRALDALEELNARTMNHTKREVSGLEKLVQPITDLAASAVNQFMAISVIPEIAMTLSRTAMNPAEYKQVVNIIKDIKGQITAEDLRLFGMTYEYQGEHSRMLGDGAIDPVTAVGKSARWWRNKSREVFGEAAITRRMKLAHTRITYSKTAKKILKVGDRMDVLATVDPNDPKAFAAAAREAGFGSDLHTAKEVRRIGLHDPEVREGLQALRDAGVEALENPRDALAVTARTEDPALRRKMNKATERLRRHAANEAETIIITRTSGTMLRTNNALAAALMQFLTFPTAWFNGFLRTRAQNSNSALAGYFMSFMLGEALAQMARDASRGNADEVLQDWEDNFPEKLAMVGTRIPVAGAWTDVVLGPVRAAAFGGQFRTGLGSAPGIEMVTRIGNELVRNTRAVGSGESLGPDDFSNTARLAPVVGSPIGTWLLNNSFE